MAESEEAPQGIEEKIAAPVEPRDTIARAPLDRLRVRLWPLKPIPPGQAPEILEFEVMGKREVWRRQAVMGGAAKESTTYELVRP